MAHFLVDAEAYAAWRAGFEATGVLGNSLMFHLMYMFHERREDFAALGKLLGRDGLDLLDSISINEIGLVTVPPQETTSRAYHVAFHPRVGSNGNSGMVGFDQLSAGTRRILRIFVSALFDKSSVMLIEQPEDGLHHGLAKKLIGLLHQNSGPTQLIFSSHSSVILDKLRPEQVRLISLHDGMTSRQITDSRRGENRRGIWRWTKDRYTTLFKRSKRAERVRSHR